MHNVRCQYAFRCILGHPTRHCSLSSWQELFMQPTSCVEVAIYATRFLCGSCLKLCNPMEALFLWDFMIFFGP